MSLFCMACWKTRKEPIRGEHGAGRLPKLPVDAFSPKAPADGNPPEHFTESLIAVLITRWWKLNFSPAASIRSGATQSCPVTRWSATPVTAPNGLSGHAVVGDARYGSKRAADYLKKNFAFDRLALHAHALTFRLPGGTEPETVTTPAIPGQMQNLFKNDR